MAIDVNRICNVNIYMNGSTLLGRAESIDLPVLKSIMKEHKALGMFGSIELPGGGMEKLEAKIKWNSFYPEILRANANPFKFVQLQARGSLERYTGQGRTAEVPLVAMLTASFKSFPLGAFKQHDNVELQTEAAVYYVKQTVDGTDIVEIDVLANIWKIAGEDVLAKYRANIGG